MPATSPGFWVSKLILADNIYTLDRKQEMLEPYSWEGVAIVPKGDDVFTSGSALWFYVHVCGPTLGPNGKPTLKTIVDLKGKRKFRGPVEIEPTKADDSCWILAQAIDLIPQFVPGDYELKLEVTDTATGTSEAVPRPRNRSARSSVTCRSSPARTRIGGAPARPSRSTS